MNLPTHLFPACLLPPEGCGALLDDPSTGDLHPWLAALRSGGPGYVLSAHGCERNADAGIDPPQDVLPLFPARPDAGTGLELDLGRLDAVISAAWDRCRLATTGEPAARSLLFRELARRFASPSTDWSLVWSWDSHGDDELEICLRAVTLHSGANPVLYHQALPEVAGRSARDVIAAGLLTLVAATPPAGGENDGPAAREPGVGSIVSLMRDLPPPPGTTQEPVWIEEALLSRAPDGEIRIVIDRGAQRACLLVDGQVAIETPVSTGAPGHATPLGSFTILEKRHSGQISAVYKCPLPRWMRLNWDGIGMHAGRLPGHPSSHGCIRLPEEGAAALFEHAPNGTPVDIVAAWDGTTTDLSPTGF